MRLAAALCLVLVAFVEGCGGSSAGKADPGVPQSAAAPAQIPPRIYADGVEIDFDPNGTPAQVYRLYRAAFSRTADQGGLGFQIAAIEVYGHSLFEVAANFMASPEFVSTYGNLQDSAFVTLLYHNVLNREPDPGGLAFWEAQLSAGVARGQVLLGFSESPENKSQTAAAVSAGLVFTPYPPTRVYLADGTYVETSADGTAAQVYRLYQAAFDRAADPAGLGYQVAAIERSGLNLAQVAQNFIASPEFVQAYGSLKDTEFITALYQNVLHRAPDPSGLQFYGSALASGTSRAQVLIDFSESPENKLQTVAAISAGIHFIPWPSPPTEPPVVVAAPADVSVLSITPAQGPAMGGTTVTITGTGFTSRTRVSFNRTAGVSVQFLDALHIQVTTPPLGDGSFATALAAVRVETDTGSSYGEFLYVPPSFDEIGIGDITTLAGVGNFIGEGRLAQNALVEAEALAFDRTGRLYLGEETGGLLRRIEANGRIVTLAGTGSVGFSGDGGPASNAQFNWPASVAVDGSGNVYVADTFGNNRIRRIDGATGIVTTVAGTGTQGYSGDGGPATLAALNVPSGVVVDAQGAIYIADAGNERIRKIATSGVISTIAGNGVAGFAGDGGAATQASFQFAGQSGAILAVDSTGVVYVDDFANQRIRRIDGDGKVATVVGGGSHVPSDGAKGTDVNSIFDNVVVDSQDRLLFSEGGARIWRLEANGTLTRIAGNGTRGLTPDGGSALSAALLPLNLAIAPNGDVYFSERSARRVRRIDAATGLLSTAAGIGPSAIGEGGSLAVAAVFSDIGNIGLDATGNILAVEPRGSLRIRRIDPGGTITTVAGIGVEPIPGFYTEGMAAVNAAMSPTSVVANARGEMFFTDFCALRRIGTDGLVRTIAGPVTSIQQCGFAGDGGPGTNALLAAEQDTVRLDAQGNMFIADLFNHRVRRVDGVSGVITTFAGSGRAASNGYDPGAPEVFAGDGGLATSALLTDPSDVAFGPQGDVCIADTGNFSVRCVNSQGIIRTVAGRGSASPGDGGPGTAVALNPYRIAFDARGNLYISDIATGTIRRLDVNGTITTIAGRNGQHGFSGDGGPAIQATLDYGSGLLVDAQGNILIFDGANRRIRVIKQAAFLGTGALVAATPAR